MPTASKRISVAPGVEAGGPGPFLLVAGPCVLESEAHAVFLAREIAAVCAPLGVPYVFKASFDKANRSSGSSFRGPGLEKGLAILATVKKETGVPVLSDVHETSQVDRRRRSSTSCRSPRSSAVRPTSSSRPPGPESR